MASGQDHYRALFPVVVTHGQKLLVVEPDDDSATQCDRDHVVAVVAMMQLFQSLSANHDLRSAWELVVVAADVTRSDQESQAEEDSTSFHTIRQQQIGAAADTAEEVVLADADQDLVATV